jgi:DNA-binding transcriptional ArsR family regulator
MESARLAAAGVGRAGGRNSEEDLDRIFAALADPTRRAILSQLAEGEASVAEIVAPHRMSQPAISKHLKILERAGLIVREVDRQRRPRRLRAEQMVPAVDWLAGFRAFWGESFDQLDALLARMKQSSEEEEDE